MLKKSHTVMHAKRHTIKKKNSENSLIKLFSIAQLRFKSFASYNAKSR